MLKRCLFHKGLELLTIIAVDSLNTRRKMKMGNGSSKRNLTS